MLLSESINSKHSQLLNQSVDEYKEISCQRNYFQREVVMLTWCALLFVLGIAAFLDTFYNYGNIFRQVNSVLFMLTSLGLLVRTTTKMRLRITEGYIARIEKLEKELQEVSRERQKAGV
jgi:hypothetical protein